VTGELRDEHEVVGGDDLMISCRHEISCRHDRSERVPVTVGFLLWLDGLVVVADRDLRDQRRN
jgi:hypothetical protein